MAVGRNRQQHSEPRQIDPENPPLDEAWFEYAEISYPGWVTLKANLDRDVVEWYKSHWKKYRTTMNQVIRAYYDGKLKVIIAGKEYNTDRVKVVGKYDPEVVAWIKKMPNQDDFMSLILRDFMQDYISHEQHQAQK